MKITLRSFYLMMQDFIDSYSVEAEAGTAPTQAEGSQL